MFFVIFEVTYEHHYLEEQKKNNSNNNNNNNNRKRDNDEHVYIYRHIDKANPCIFDE